MSSYNREAKAKFELDKVYERLLKNSRLLSLIANALAEAIEKESLGAKAL